MKAGEREGWERDGAHENRSDTSGLGCRERAASPAGDEHCRLEAVERLHGEAGGEW